MVRASKAAVRRALKAYCDRRPKWVRDLRDKLRTYADARRAFRGTGDLASFQKVYTDLRKWKVFRGGRVKPAKWVFQRIAEFGRRLQRRRLSELRSADWPRIWHALQRLREIKPVGGGKPSVTAISKFLHVWNPRLFVICDRQEVEQFVFGHRWLADQLSESDSVLQTASVDAHEDSGLTNYLRMLAFSSAVAKAHPFLATEFARTVRHLLDRGSVPGDIGSYEATAVEWCFVGLAEMPPAGVKLL